MKRQIVNRIGQEIANSFDTLLQQHVANVFYPVFPINGLAEYQLGSAGQSRALGLANANIFYKWQHHTRPLTIHEQKIYYTTTSSNSRCYFRCCVSKQDLYLGPTRLSPFLPGNILVLPQMPQFALLGPVVLQPQLAAANKQVRSCVCNYVFSTIFSSNQSKLSLLCLLKSSHFCSLIHVQCNENTMKYQQNHEVSISLTQVCVAIAWRQQGDNSENAMQ